MQGLLRDNRHPMDCDYYNVSASRVVMIKFPQPFKLA